MLALRDFFKIVIRRKRHQCEWRKNDGFALKTGAVSDVSRSVFQLTLTAQANVTRRVLVKWRDQHTHEQLEIAKMIKLHLHA